MLAQCEKILKLFNVATGDWMLMLRRYARCTTDIKLCDFFIEFSLIFHVSMNFRIGAVFEFLSHCPVSFSVSSYCLHF